MPDERKILEAECSGLPEDGGFTLGRVELPPFRGCFIKTGESAATSLEVPEMKVCMIHV